MPEKTQQGVEYLEDVILDVLRKAEVYGDPPLNAGEITRRAGIPFEHETGSSSPYYDITRGILLLLESKGKVERPAGKRTWQIVPERNHLIDV